MRLTLSIFQILSIAALASFAGAVVVLHADTPSFYLVASSKATGPNLLPLRTSGGSGGYATLTGSGPIGVFYFYQGILTAAPAPGSTSTRRPFIGAVPTSNKCLNYGQLGFSTGSTTNKCALFSSFWIQSDTENSQLGAALTFNFVGGFYACGSGKDVWYQASPTSGPPGLLCTPIALWTVPLYGP